MQKIPRSETEQEYLFNEKVYAQKENKVIFTRLDKVYIALLPVMLWIALSLFASIAQVESANCSNVKYPYHYVLYTGVFCR